MLINKVDMQMHLLLCGVCMHFLNLEEFLFLSIVLSRQDMNTYSLGAWYLIVRLKGFLLSKINSTDFFSHTNLITLPVEWFQFIVKLPV